MVPPSRIACLLIPALPLAAALRAHPELAERPFAIASAKGPRGEILAATPEAMRRGVAPGRTVAHARASCAELRVQVISLVLERAARDALLDAALSTSPRAELAPPGSGPHAAEAAVFVDARGVKALFRSERGFASALGERARRLGLPGVVTVASSRGTAQILARRLAWSGETLLVVSPGEDAAALSPLPLDLLDPPDDLAAAFTRFGLRKVEDLLRLPERALVQRLGARILPLLERARGRQPTAASRRGPSSSPPPTASSPCSSCSAGCSRGCSTVSPAAASPSATWSSSSASRVERGTPGVSVSPPRPSTRGWRCGWWRSPSSRGLPGRLRCRCV